MTRLIFVSLFIGAACPNGSKAFVAPAAPTLRSTKAARNFHLHETNPIQGQISAATTALLTFSLFSAPLIINAPPSFAAISDGASLAANAKLTTGGASTLQSGRTISITRGVNLDNSDFSKQNLKGVAFQQSIVRDTDFRGANLVGASFFDATLDGSNFEDAGAYLQYNIP